MKAPNRIRFSVGISTFAMIMVLVSSIMIVAYYFHQDTMRAHDRTVRQVSAVLQQVEARTSVLTGALILTLDSIVAVTGLTNDREEIGQSLQVILAPVLVQNPSITSAYVGYADGEFTQIVSFVDRDLEARGPYRATKDADFAYVRVIPSLDGGGDRIVQPVSPTGRAVGAPWQEPSDYDPRVRPWYRKGGNGAQSQYFLTDPYVFSKSRQPGITISRPLTRYDLGTAGVDVDLQSLTVFLEELKLTDETRLAIISPSGYLLSHTHLDPVEAKTGDDGVVQLSLRKLEPEFDPILSTLIGRPEHSETMTDFLVQDDRFLGSSISINLGGGAAYSLLIAVPWDEIAAPLYQSRNRALAATMALAAIVMILAVFVGRWLAKPIEKLTGEAEAIGQLDFDQQVTIRSPFSEIQQLNDAMSSMKQAISTFARYLPRSLVAQLVESGASAELGGTRRDLAIMFSDIEGFTTITEKSASGPMMHQLSQYFEGQSNAILKHNGTIDKFIGDAVMAFWNAPRDDLEMASNACKAVLEASNALATLNVRWDIEGRPALETRYGLHLGSAVVGNVGSSERMNYTAMGASVNLAARLEGLNKFFETTILASDAVRKRTGNAFIWRTVGLVNPKGVLTPVLVHELLGLAHALPDLQGIKPVSTEKREQADRWNIVFDCYLKGRWEECRGLVDAFLEQYPEDTVARYYSERVDHYIENPPTGAWVGAEEFSTK